MEVKELTKNDESLSAEKINDLFRSIVLGKDVTEIIKTEQGEFEVKFPRSRDVAEIGRLTALRLNGIAAHCFDANTYNVIKCCATLDVIVVKGPSWYELAKSKNINFSWQDIPSEKLIAEVYAKAFEFREKVQIEIDGNKENTDSGMASDERSKNTSESGLFDGISS